MFQIFLKHFLEKYVTQIVYSNKFSNPKTPINNKVSDWGWVECPKVTPDEGATCTQNAEIEHGDLVEFRYF